MVGHTCPLLWPRRQSHTAESPVRWVALSCDLHSDSEEEHLGPVLLGFLKVLPQRLGERRKTSQAETPAKSMPFGFFGACMSLSHTIMAGVSGRTALGSLLRSPMHGRPRMYKWLWV